MGAVVDRLALAALVACGGRLCMSCGAMQRKPATSRSMPKMDTARPSIFFSNFSQVASDFSMAAESIASMFTFNRAESARKLSMLRSITLPNLSPNDSSAASFFGGVMPCKRRHSCGLVDYGRSCTHGLRLCLWFW